MKLRKTRQANFKVEQVDVGLGKVAMGTSKVTFANSSYVIRPALVEAKLMTEKQGRDEVYVVTLKEELRKIESIIANMENQLQLSTPTTAQNSCSESEGSNARWIRAKSCELDLRLRRVEQAADSNSTRKPLGLSKPGSSNQRTTDFKPDPAMIDPGVNSGLY
jgi:hypothetical protein